MGSIKPERLPAVCIRPMSMEGKVLDYAAQTSYCLRFLHVELR